MTQKQYRAPKGTRDILPGAAERHRNLVQVFQEQAQAYGFGHVMTPIFEHLGVFTRIGESTDIVTKEMYDFEDKSGTQMALRPELTASVVRAFIQNNPQQLPWKVWYEGPQFRYERPQAGRYRQFSQLGVEALGSYDPIIDAEIIALGASFYKAVGLRKVKLLLNSLGDRPSRAKYLTALQSYFNDHRSDLSEQSITTLEKNPLRVLDSKRPQDAGIIEAAPVMADFLEAEPKEHFNTVRECLEKLQIGYEISPRLVRGLDYYGLTTFEYQSEALDSAQNAVGGGGRYDELAEQLGGKPTGGIGFAIGIDRVLLAADSEGVFDTPDLAPDVFVIDVVGGMQAAVIISELASLGISAQRSYDNRSMKAQFRAADRSGASLGVIIGEDELKAGEITVRELASQERIQQRVKRSEMIDELKKRLSK